MSDEMTSVHYFMYTEYKNGRVSIRDRPYKTLSSARSAQKRRQVKLAGNTAVKAVRISITNKSDLSDVDVKNLTAI